MVSKKYIKIIWQEGYTEKKKLYVETYQNIKDG